MSGNSIKNLGGAVGGAIGLAVIIAIPVALLMGVAELSVWALKWIPQTIGWATLIAILLIPLALVPASRGFAGSLFVMVSGVYLICTWLYAMAFTYLEWGVVGLIIGIMLFGMGVLLTGALAAIFTGAWVVLGNLAILLALFVGSRLIGSWLLESADKRAMQRLLRERPAEAIVIQKGPDE